MRNTGGDKYETTSREIQNDQIGQMEDDIQKSDSYGLKSERPTSTWSLACVSTNLDAFCPMGVHLPSEKLILPYFSGPRGVAILDCDSHSQAGSTSLHGSSQPCYMNVYN